jgi:Leucine-rich repeat (LRR) protein
MSIMFPARLLAHEEERQIFENEEGSLLEICATSPFFGRDTYFAEGAPLDALIIDDDDDDDANNNNNNAEDIERSMPPSTCFRTSVTNDNKLHWFHVGRAALLTLVFMSMLYSFDCALSAFRDSTTQTSRRSLQFTSIIEAVNEMLNQLQPNLTIIINDDSIVFTESPVTIAPSPIGISNVTMAPSPLLSVLTDESVRTALETASSSELLDDPSSPQGKAFAWMMTNNTHMRVNSTFIIQRYVMVVMDFAFHPDGSNETTLSNPTTHECTWEGVTCGNGTVMSIKWPGKGLGGSIPSEIRFLQSLAVLDLGENTIGGSIPNELYALTSLTTLYLHENALTGPLSEDVGTLYSLVNFYAHNNLLTGTIPSSIGSIQRAGRPLRKYTEKH